MPPTGRLYPSLDDELPNRTIHSTPINKSILDLEESINFNVSCITPDICPVCTTPVLDEDPGLACEGKCKRWFHAACVNVSHSEYLFIQRLSSNLKYFCSPCFAVTPGSESFKAPPKCTTTEPLAESYVPPSDSAPDEPNVRPTPLVLSDASIQVDLEPILGSSSCPDVRHDAAHPTVVENAGATAPVPKPDPPHIPKQIRIVYGAADPLSNMFSFDFCVNNCWFKSLEQAYHYDRALRQGKSSLAHQILQTTSPFKCKTLARSLHKNPSADLELMRSLLRLKLDQSDVFRNSLVESIGKTLLHSTHAGDNFWCTGLEHDAVEAHSGVFPGKNMFGMLLTELRDSSIKTHCEGINSASLLNSHVSFPSEFNVLTANQSRCNNCFETGHSKDSCGFKRTVFCRACGKKGHKQKFCSFFGGNPSLTKYPNNAFTPPPVPLPHNRFMYNYSLPYAYSHPPPMPTMFQSDRSFIQRPPFQFSPSHMNSSAKTQAPKVGRGKSGFPQVFPK